MEKENTQKSIYDNNELIEWGGFLNEFLWICAGVDRKVVRQCPTEYAKYAGIGGTILFTALMAMLSGGYALFTVFDNLVTAIFFGIFWGLLIFNLDRFIVNTMYSDGKVTISPRELYSGMPRIIMAIFLGIVISTPLELKIFEDAIDIRIEQDKDDMVNEKIGAAIQERDSIAHKRDEVLNGGNSRFDVPIETSGAETKGFNEQKDALNNQLKQIIAKINDLNGQIYSLDRIVKDMSSDDSNKEKETNRLKGLRNRRNSFINQRDDINHRIKSIDKSIAQSKNNFWKLINGRQSEIENESTRLQNDIDSINRIINDANIRHKDWSKKEIKENGSFRDKLDIEYKGFQAKMKAFNELKEESQSTNVTSIFIMLLFIIIETAPTFFKMMIASGPYDDLLRAEMHRFKVLSEKRIKNLDDEFNNDIKISVEKNKARLEAELKANSKVLDKLALAQSELIEIAIEEWKTQELAKIKNNPSEYISINSSKE